MPFQPGNIANPDGRPKGSRNRRTQEILDLIAGRGDKDPLNFLSEVISGNGAYTPELKIQASNILAPYLHSKRGTLPAPRFVEEAAIQVPDFQSIEQAQEIQKEIARRAAAGELELQASLDISTLVGNWIRSRQATIELDMKVADAKGITAEHRIIIEGGLPELPGTDVIMPVMNGAHGQGGELSNGHPPAIDVVLEDQETISGPATDAPSSIDRGSPDFQETNPRSAEPEAVSSDLSSTDPEPQSPATDQTNQDPQP